MVKREIFAGADVLLDSPALLADLAAHPSVGMVTNPTGITRSGDPVYEQLAGRIPLTALFSPEHGVRGEMQAGAVVDAYTDAHTALPVHSLYGPGRAQAEEVLASLGCLLFDIQDIGSRYYTYQYTLTDCMKVAAAHGVPVWVLDRPPFIGCEAQGNLLDPRFASGVGRFPIPARTGGTIGELAKYLNENEGIGCDLTVIPCRGVRSAMFFDEGDLPLVNPSPNLPSADCALIYVGTCLFEGTNLSEGRGTTRPFELFGAPWLDSARLLRELRALDLPGCLFRETCFTPMFSKYAGELCRGIQIHLTDRRAYRPFDVGVWLITLIRRQHPEEFRHRSFLFNLFGSDEILRENFDPAAYLAGLESPDSPLAEYRRKLAAYRMYE
ncbi:MAG: DUF1343 domain-containing protein [Clostridiales bacterium]|nr:DUF1343 domain-containing protein [Clostridiales bacterium]